MELLYILRILWNRRNIILIIFISVICLIAGLSVLTTPTFEMKARLLVTTDAGSEMLIRSTGLSSYGMISSSDSSAAEVYESLLSESHKLLGDFIDKTGIKRESAKSQLIRMITMNNISNKNNAMKTMSTKDLTNPSPLTMIFPIPKLDISIYGDTSMLDIITSAYTVDDAAMMANTFCDMARNYESQIYRDSVLKALSPISVYMNNTMELYRSNLNEMAKFRQKNKISDVTTELTNISDRIQDIKTDMETSRLGIKTSQAAIKMLLSKRNAKNDDMPSFDDLTALKASLIKDMLQLAEYETQYTAEHPEVIQISKKINDTKALLKKTTNNIIMSDYGEISSSQQAFISNLVTMYTSLVENEASVAMYQLLINEYQGRLSEMTGKQVNSVLLDHNLSVISELYDVAKQYHVITDMLQSIDINRLVVVSPAILPADPDRYRKPNLTFRIVVALFLGSILGVAGGLLRDYIDITVRRRSDIPVYSAPVTFIENGKLKLPFSNAGKFDSFPTNELSNIRYISNVLLLASTKNRNKMVLVISSVPSEGKSFISAISSIDLALRGHKVLLFDCNLSNPSLSKYFSLKAKSCDTNEISSNNDLSSIVYSTQYSNLLVICLDKLSRDISVVCRTGVINELREKFTDFDVVIFDGPSLSNGAEILTCNIEPAIAYVVGHGIVSREKLAGCLDILHAAEFNPAIYLMNTPGCRRSLNEVCCKIRRIFSKIMFYC